MPFANLKKWKKQAPTAGSDNLKRGEINQKIGPTIEPKTLNNQDNSVVTSKRIRPLTTKLSPTSHDLLVKIAYQKRKKLVEVLEEGIELVGEKEKIRL